MTIKNNPVNRRVIRHKPDVLNRYAVKQFGHETNKKALEKTPMV